jgi:hypothetical protein
MKHYSKKIFFITSIFALLYACKNTGTYTAEIKNLDSLLMRIDTVYTHFQEIYTTTIRKQLININFNLDYFEKNNQDSISKQTTLDIKEYSTIKNPFLALLKEYPEALEMQEECREQINHLKHDLKVESIDKTKAKEYFQEELIAAQDCFIKLDYLTQLNTYYQQRFAEYNPKIEALVQAIRDKKK